MTAARGVQSAYGGCIYATDSNELDLTRVTIRNSLVDSLYGGFSGGGVLAIYEESKLRLTECLFAQTLLMNAVASGYGGAVNAEMSCELWITSSTIIDTSAISLTASSLGLMPPVFR